ncbi:MAG: DNA methyltransferase, partial [Alphaproteobacteria bacterium]|nr:DNA methyltransferase [Alphaproteobacteria bacterium]
PETLTVIDPACGSGHILVEAYDLLREIYLERGYALRDIPELILKNNLFGIDIDKRAAQLATFALAMKAAQDNPKLLGKTIPVNIINIVESNNMDVDAIANTLATRDVPADTIKSLLDNFENAQTYGSLIKIKHDLIEKLDDIATMIAKAENTNDMIKQEYANQLKPFVVMGQFLTRKYDAVVANPPYMGYGKYNLELKDFAIKNYPNSKADLCAMFMEQALFLIKDTAFYAMINQQSWMFQSSFEMLRHDLLHNTICSMAHMGMGAFGADFGTSAFVIRKTQIKDYIGTYVSLREEKNIEAKRDLFISGQNRFYVNEDKFTHVPGCLIAYWISDNMQNVFENSKPLNDIMSPRQGTSTGNNDLFLRCWHEVNANTIFFDCKNSFESERSNCKWYPVTKGGDFRKWYGNNDYV